MGSADPLVLGLDQGTSATKVIAVNAAGAIEATGRAGVTETHPAPGWVEQDPMRIWDSAREAVAACLSEVDASRVRAVGLSNQRESMLAWNPITGHPYGPLISWQDRRGAPLCRQLVAAGAGPDVRRISGLDLDPMFSASRAAWLLENYAGHGELAIGTVDSWLLFQLGAGHVIESGNASRTQLVDLETGDWSSKLLDVFAVPRDVLPAIVPSNSVLGDAGRLHPSLTGTRIAGVLADSHAAYYAHAGWIEGRVKATYGTGSSILTLAGSSTVDGLARSVAWADPQVAYALEGNIRSAGATVQWLAQLLGSTAEELAASAGASSGGVHIVPAFGGLGAPWWDDAAVGLISGLSFGSTREQLARAAVESIALQVADVVAAMRHGSAVSELLVDGGPTGNQTLMQLQADLVGVPVRAAAVAQLSALGAAHLAGLGAGIWTPELLAGLDRGYRCYEPAWPAGRRDEVLSAWHQAVDRARLSR